MKSKKLAVIFALSAAMMAGCGKKEASQETNQEQKAQELTIKQNEILFTQLGQTQLIQTEGGNEITWSSSDDSVASVQGGVVMAKGNGTALITGKTNEQEANCVVKVESNFGIKIEGEKVIQLSSKKDNKVTLTATVELPTIFDQVNDYSFSSSDETIATVDEKTGEVTAVGQGITTIVATTKAQQTKKLKMMGKEIVQTQPETDSITVVVDNEIDTSKQNEIIGSYMATYDWQGFDKELSQEYAYTSENFKWIRSILSLELEEDGTFHQKVLNAQRAGYPEQAICPEVSDPEKSREVRAFYVYNRFDQSPTDYNETGKEFHQIEGMSASGVNNFVETGVYAVFHGNLVLFYQGKTKDLGPIEGMKWLENKYEPFTNMVRISENMTMKLEKVKEQ